MGKFRAFVRPKLAMDVRDYDAIETAREAFLKADNEEDKIIVLVNQGKATSAEAARAKAAVKTALERFEAIQKREMSKPE